MIKSHISESELSESIDIESEEDEEEFDEGTEDSIDFGKIRARNIPCLQSICGKLRKNPKNERFSKNSISMISSGKSSTRASKIVHERQNSIYKNSFSMLGSFIAPKPKDIVRRTIYIDENNNIVHNGFRKSSHMGKLSIISLF